MRRTQNLGERRLRILQRRSKHFGGHLGEMLGKGARRAFARASRRDPGQARGAL